MPEKDDRTRLARDGGDRVGTKQPLEQEPAVADLTAELAAAKDRLAPSLADQEDIRVQLLRDRVEAVRHAETDFASDLLSSIDNLERAIASVSKDQPLDLAVAGLLTGVEATHRSLLDSLSKHGIRRFDPIGEPFDPHWHEASFEAIAAPEKRRGVIAVSRVPGRPARDPE